MARPLNANAKITTHPDHGIGAQARMAQSLTASK